MRIKTKDITLCALFAAFMAVAAQICIPTPSGVAITLQSFAVALCGAVLGVKKGLITTLVYIFIGLVGVPVFSSFTGGIGALANASGGFIIGFLPLVALCAPWRDNETKLISACKAALGLFFCYVFGVAWFSFVTGNGIFSAMLYNLAVFAVKDALCIAVALSIGKILRKRI